MSLPDNVDAFVHGWIDAWNAHNLDAILAHYAEDIAFNSPFVARLKDKSGGENALHGRTALGDYFRRALERYPNLSFRLRHVFVGVESLVLYYDSVSDRRAAEVMVFNEAGQVSRVWCHYDPPLD